MPTQQTALAELIALQAEWFNRHDNVQMQDCAAALTPIIARMEAESGWLPIENFGTSAVSVLVYHPGLDKDAEFPGHPFQVVNRLWAKLHAADHGYTMWRPLHPPADAMPAGET